MTAARETPVALAAERLAGFPAALRQAGLPVDPSRAIDFLKAARLVRLRGIGDLSRAGRVTLTGSPDDFPVFDAVFEQWFGETATVAGKKSPDEQEAPRNDRPGNRETLLDLFDGDAAGNAASEDHLRNRKTFGRAGETDRRVLARLKRQLHRLPVKESRSWSASPIGSRIDIAATGRAARKTFGETLRILKKARPQRPRRLLLLVDVSGSMKAQSESTLRFAHLITRARPKVETFCFGTRLSRITGRLKRRDGDEALAGLADLVFDFDGGTLIGASLEHFLSVSRYAALVRGAVTLVFSDGLERGDIGPMIHAVHRLARLSHRLVWVTPLAADPRYRPITRAMAGIVPALDAICDGSSLPALEKLVRDMDALEKLPRGQAARRFSQGGALQ